MILLFLSLPNHFLSLSLSLFLVVPFKISGAKVSLLHEQLSGVINSANNFSLFPVPSPVQ